MVTFKEAADGWIETHKPARKHGDSGSQMKNAAVLLHQHGASLATKRVAEITPNDVQAALKDLWERAPMQGRRALNMWERVFDFANAKGWMQGQNPAEWKGLMQYGFPRVRKQDRGHYAAMPYEALPDFMRQLRQKQERSTGATALEFLIRTCARTGEVLGAQWDEIDWDKKLWTLSAERTKQGRGHVVPLCARAIELLTLQRQYANGSPFIFTGYRQTKMADQAMKGVLNVMGVQARLSRL